MVFVLAKQSRFPFIIRESFIIFLGVNFLSPNDTNKSNVASICVENKNLSNVTISVACYDVPTNFLQNFSVFSAGKIKEFRTFLISPLIRTVR